MPHNDTYAYYPLDVSFVLFTTGENVFKSWMSEECKEGTHTLMSKGGFLNVVQLSIMFSKRGRLVWLTQGYFKASAFILYQCIAVLVLKAFTSVLFE